MRGSSRFQDCAKWQMPWLGADPAPDVPAAHTWGLIGDSEPIAQLRTQVEAAAREPHDVLLVGEPGAGKATAARAVHRAGGGAPGGFVAVDCASLPRELVELRLFGQARARGDSHTAVPGHVHAAEGGTLYLGELTALGADVQARLLELVETRAVRSVGAVRVQPLAFRLVASTARDPEQAMAQGLLRPELYRRLAPGAIAVPPLRDHRGDVPALVDHFLQSFCSRRCGCIWGAAPEALAALAAVDWPGNVRELRMAVDHAVTSGSSGVLQLADFPNEVRQRAARLPRTARQPRPRAGVEAAHDKLRLPTLAEAETRLARLAVDRAAGNKLKAANALGISRHKLYDLLRRSGS